MKQEGLDEFMKLLTPQYRVFAAHLLVIIDKIAEENKKERCLKLRFEA